MRKLFLFSNLLITITLCAQDTYIQCGKLIDTRNGKVESNKTIIVSGKTIKSIQNGFVNPTSTTDKIIDLKNKTVMPGWIVMHVYLEGETSLTVYLEKFTLNDADIAYDAEVFARTTKHFHS